MPKKRMPRMSKPKLPPLPDHVRTYIHKRRRVRDEALKRLNTQPVNQKLRDALKHAGISHVLTDDLLRLDHKQVELFHELVSHEFENLLDYFGAVFDLGDLRDHF